jgi:three-Cys-motif partner protein
MMSSRGFTEIEPHTLHKYSILEKYLNVCKIFDQRYSNFVYVDTHGGSGKVYLKGKGKWINGSPLIAANWAPNFPCHIVEIDPEKYSHLCESTNSCTNAHIYQGDCNKLIDSILSKIPKGEKFVCCFVDPESLVYRGSDGTECDQICADTIRKITAFPRSELLLNFPLEAILRCAGDYFRNPNEPRAIANGERVTTFMGSTSWQELPEREQNRRAFLELYMEEMLESYLYKGAILIRSETKNLPLYYLVYVTHNLTAAKIMRDIMKKEGSFPLYYDIFTGKPQTLDGVYPLERFIFESN